MVSVRSKEQEAAEDVFFGQVVMIWAVVPHRRRGGPGSVDSRKR